MAGLESLRGLLLVIFCILSLVAALPAPYWDANGVPKMNGQTTVAHPGTEMINHYTGAQSGGGFNSIYSGGKTCFSDDNSKCARIDRGWALVAADQFCQKVDGMIFDMKNPNTSVFMNYRYWPRSSNSNSERGKIFMQIGFAPDIPEPFTAYTMDYTTCHEQLIQTGAIDMCNSMGEKHKAGGVITYNPSRGNDHLFYLIDPNPLDDVEGVAFCHNTYPFHSLASNCNDLGTQDDGCYSAWNGMSPVDIFEGHPPQNDCHNPKFTTKLGYESTGGGSPFDSSD